MLQAIYSNRIKSKTILKSSVCQWYHLVKPTWSHLLSTINFVSVITMTYHSICVAYPVNFRLKLKKTKRKTKFLQTNLCWFEITCTDGHCNTQGVLQCHKSHYHVSCCSAGAERLRWDKRILMRHPQTTVWICWVSI